jgi:hypothetical protein
MHCQNMVSKSGFAQQPGLLLHGNVVFRLMFQQWDLKTTATEVNNFPNLRVLASLVVSIASLRALACIEKENRFGGSIFGLACYIVHQVKKFCRKPDVNVTTVNIKQKLGILNATGTKEQDPDRDLPQNVTDPEYWLQKGVREAADLFNIMYRIKLLLDVSFTRLLLTSNEGPVRIQYKCLVPIYVFPEMKLRCLVISKTE